MQMNAMNERRQPRCEYVIQLIMATEKQQTTATVTVTTTTSATATAMRA